MKCNFTKQPVDQHRLINLYNLHVYIYILFTRQKRTHKKGGRGGCNDTALHQAFIFCHFLFLHCMLIPINEFAQMNLRMEQRDPSLWNIVRDALICVYFVHLTLT